MDDSAMDETDEAMLSVWRENPGVLTESVGAVTRLARMMSVSGSMLKLILAGQREFGEEFVRGVEAVTGLPAGWMNTPHRADEIPQSAQTALDTETPLAKFRGTALPVRKKTVLKSSLDVLTRGEAARRAAESASAEAEQNRRRAHFRKARELAAQEARRLEWHINHPPVELAVLRAKIEEAIEAALDLDERTHADLTGRIEQIEKHHDLLKRHLEKLLALLAEIDPVERD